MKTRKILRVWNPQGDVPEFSFLNNAIVEATKQALKNGKETVVTLDYENTETGDILHSCKVAIIRPSKFNKHGQIK